jgi:hypothetical protein
MASDSFIDLVNRCADQTVADLQFSTMANILVTKCQWTRVTTRQSKYPPDVAYTVRKWVDDNCSGEYKVSGRVWVFEKSSDATMFILAWGGI